MATSVAPMSSTESTQAHSASPDLDRVKNSGDSRDEDEDEKITFKTVLTIIAAVGIPMNGFAAVGVLNDILGLTTSAMMPALELIPRYAPSLFVGVALPAFGHISSKKMWLLASGILCSLTVACVFARIDNQFLILRTLIGFVVAVMQTASLDYVGWSLRRPGPIRYTLFFPALAIGPLYASFLGFLLSHVSSWQQSCSVLAIMNVVLLTLSIIALPKDSESQKTAETFEDFTHIDLMNRIMGPLAVGLMSCVIVVSTRMSQPQSTILPMAPISIMACVNMSSRTKNEGHVEEDPTVMEDGGLVRQHRLKAQTLLACVQALRSLSGPISYLALLYLCFYALEGQEYMSTVEQIIVLQICTGGAILARFLVNVTIVGLSVTLMNTLVVRSMLRSSATGEDPSEAGTGDTGSCYPACPLTAPDSIRVIRLHPGSPGDKLQCTLAAVRLEENPTYEALSYCWGRRASNNHIECHSSSSPAATNDDLAPAAALAITDTLHDALVCLRHTKDERVLWVDQICINQKDNEERSAQVKLMQKIYSSTRCAIVWLRVGLPVLPEWLVAQRSELPRFYQRIENAIAKLAEDDGLESDPAFEPGHKVRSKRPLRDMTNDELARYGLPREKGGGWHLFYGFFDSPWFSRVWVVQEVAWPREVKVHYTNMETSWEQFTRVMAFVESLEIEIFDPKRRAVGHFFSRLRALQACRKNTRAGSPKPLDQVLSQHRVAAATDPRDHIYGLMGLASEQPPPLEPDYGANTSSVFLEATRWAVRDGRLDILGLGGDPSSPDRPKDLPSWAPDFSDASGPHSLTGMGMLPRFEVSSLKQFRAGGGPVVAPRIRGDGVMEIAGQLIGRVREVTAGAAPGRDTLDTHRMRATAQIESNTLHVSSTVREGLRMLNTKMEWEKMAGELLARSRGHYKHTGESMGDAVMRTCLLGETDEILEKMRSLYENDQLQLRVWRLLTLGRGCSWPLLGYAIMAVAFMGLLAADLLLCRCEYRYIMRNGEYHARRQISAERELFYGTNGLVGLAPRWAVAGDEMFVLRGGKVPVLLRRDGDSGPYQFVGEAYVHGAMQGDMFDLHKCENLLIA